MGRSRRHPCILHRACNGDRAQPCAVCALWVDDDWARFAKRKPYKKKSLDSKAPDDDLTHIGSPVSAGTPVGSPTPVSVVKNVFNPCQTTGPAVDNTSLDSQMNFMRNYFCSGYFPPAWSGPPLSQAMPPVSAPGIAPGMGPAWLPPTFPPPVQRNLPAANVAAATMSDLIARDQARPISDPVPRQQPPQASPRKSAWHWDSQLCLHPSRLCRLS